MDINGIIEKKKQYDELCLEVQEKTKQTLEIFHRSSVNNLTSVETANVSSCNGDAFTIKIMEYEFTVKMLEGSAINRNGATKKDDVFLLDPMKVMADDKTKNLLSGSIMIFAGVNGLFNIVQGRFFVNHKGFIAYESLSGWKTVPFFKEIDNLEDYFFQVLQNIIKSTMLEIETYWKPEDEIKVLNKDDIFSNNKSIGFE